MKPAAFEYDAPHDIDEVLALLAEHGDDVRVLAGGQSLVPLMNFRLVRPTRLVDLNDVADLAFIRDGDDGVSVGAMTRQRTVEQDLLARQRCPLLTRAIMFIGHPQIRNRGTVGGSISHADPAAELPVVACALGATMTLTSATGQRSVAADDFFVGFFTTVIEPTELLTEIAFPRLGPRTGTAFAEYTRRSGDFALAGAAAVVTLAEDGACHEVRIGLLGAGPRPERALAAEAILTGRRLDGAALRDASARVQAEIEPTGDAHGGADYRRALIGAMAERALSEASTRAAVAP